MTPHFSLQLRDGAVTLVKESSGGVSEDWCTVDEIDELFDACSRKWGTNWNLEKVVVAIRESDIS